MNLIRTLATALLFGSGALVAQTLYTPGGTVSSSANGFTGVGTANPLGTGFTVSGSTPNIFIQDTAASGQTYYLSSRWGGYFTLFNTSSNTPFLSFGSSGNMGVGVTIAGNKLDVAGNVVIGSGYAGGGGYAPANGLLVQGNVGIGTTSPSAPLTIESGGIAGSLTNSNDNNTYIALGPWKSAGGHDYRIGVDYSTLWFGSWNNFRWYRTQTGSIDMVLNNGFLGIGTASPSAKFDLEAASYEPLFLVHSNTAGNNVGKFINDFVGGVVFGDGASGNALQVLSPSGVGTVTVKSSGYVGIGTINPTQLLTVNGAVRAKEVIVDTGWSDYVFDEHYKLAPLSEVESHIKAEKHLPGIPSAQQVAEHGISLGDMQAKLLAKIEELTLHQIEQEKRLSVQSEKLAAQSSALAAQSTQLSAQSEKLADQAARIERLETENLQLKSNH